MKLIDYKKISWVAMLIVILLSFGFLYTGYSDNDKLKHPVYTKIYSDSSSINYPIISPNGKFIVFSKLESTTQANLFIIPSDGSKSPLRITTGNYYDAWPKWSPLGNKIVFFSDRGNNVSDIYTLEVSQESGLAANELKRITLSGGLYPEWSPDAKQILFVNFEKDVKTLEFNLIPSNGGLPKTIYSMARQFPMYWKFSPNGKFIYFSKRNDLWENSIFRISSSGGEAELLYEKKTILDISPKGDFLVMVDKNKENPDRGNYYLIGPSNGKGKTQKIPVLKNMVITSWGNDENYFFANSTEYMSSLRIVNSYGGKYRELTDGRGYDYPPVWSPDGKVIAYKTALNGSISLMLIPASGGAARQIPTKNILNNPNWLIWSPNGKMLATRSYNKKGILVIDLESNKEYLLLLQDAIKYVFVWSNDSKSLYYEVSKNSKNYINRVGLDGKVTTILSSKSGLQFLDHPVDQDKIYLIRETASRDSSILISISLKSKQEKEILRLKGTIGEVSISPNGKLAAFSWQQDIKSFSADIFLMSFDEVKPVKIASTQPKGYLYMIKWDKDGSRIFFIEADESGLTHINSVSVNDRQKTTLTEFDPSPKYRYDISPDGSQIVYTADVSKNSLIWRLDISEILKEYKTKLEQ